MRSAFAAIDQQLASLILRRSRRRYLILRLLPAWWLEPLVMPRVRRLKIKLVIAALGLSLLFAAAFLCLAATALGAAPS
jgi:hypothetical protein